MNDQNSKPSRSKLGPLNKYEASDAEIRGGKDGMYRNYERLNRYAEPMQGAFYINTPSGRIYLTKT